MTLNYTANGQVDYREDGNQNRTDYRYDGFDRLSRTTFPDNSYEAQGYDDNGNVISLRKRDGKTLIHAIDGLNQTYQTTVPGESTLYFDFDGLGRQTAARRGGNTVSTHYDGLGRIESTATNGYTLSYHYDAAGRRDRLTYPDGFYVTYQYDASNALTAILEYQSKTLVGYGYDSLGRLTSQTRANGVRTTIGYDDISRVDQYDHAGINDASFSRNPANQLVSRVVSNDSYQIKVPSVGYQDYGVNALNQYTQVKGNSLSYDLNGNLTQFDGWTYRYNAHNRLVSANKTGSALTLSYDATGRLFSSTLNGSTTQFLYDNNELVAEFSSTGTLLRRYVHGILDDDPVVWYEGNGTGNARYLLSNEQGSILTETSATGSVLGQHQYGPFGEPGNQSSSRFRYTGQILLLGTELYYYKARVYHPKLGRFMQTDPIGYEDGMNWYAYVGNDPMNRMDPTGEFAFLIPAVGALIGGYTAYNQARNMGLSKIESAIAGGFGALIGAVSGGTTGTAASIGVKVAAQQAAKQSSTKLVAKMLGSTVSGGVSGAATQAVADASGDISQGNSVNIDTNKVIEKGIEGAGTGLAAAIPAAVAGPSIATDIAGAAIATVLEEQKKK